MKLLREIGKADAGPVCAHWVQAGSATGKSFFAKLLRGVAVNPASGHSLVRVEIAYDKGPKLPNDPDVIFFEGFEEAENCTVIERCASRKKSCWILSAGELPAKLAGMAITKWKVEKNELTPVV